MVYDSIHDGSSLAAAATKLPLFEHKRSLVEGAGMFKTFIVMLYCHFSVALLCLNVLFDLILLGFPVFVLHRIGVLPTKLYLSFTTEIINWTTPIVFTMPMILSGTKIYCNDIELLVEAKSKNSLLLANHGSRIDWMVGMFVGFTQSMAGRVSKRIRVGFVCEAPIQFMPLIGWYRKLVCHDIFVWRSFKQDSPTIKNNIRDFHTADECRMLFLSPEGLVVDYDEKDREYISECRQFCIDQQYLPFEYVLTPRYKGSMTLLEQVRHCKGPVVSICLAYIRDGKLLNCSLLSPHRVVPDIYTLNQGCGSNPVDVYIHLKRMHIPQDMNDPKTFMMENYKEKDQILAEWQRQLNARTASEDKWMNQFTLITNNEMECFCYQIGHLVMVLILSVLLNRVDTFIRLFGTIFCLVSGCHTIGWLLNSTSAESVPFETGIKAIALSIKKRKKYCDDIKKKL